MPAVTHSAQRRHLLQAACASLLPTPWSTSAQASFPNRPVRTIVPLPAGGAADQSVRILGDYMRPHLGQSIVIDNKPGGLYMIGLQGALSAPADGYTLIHLNATMCAVQASTGRFDLLRQFAPLGLMGMSDVVLAVSSQAPFRTLPEMIAWNRANPGKLSYGSLGPGSMDHLMMVSILGKDAPAASNIPFKGGPEAAMALARGEIDAMTMAVSLLVQSQGRFRAIGVLSDQRSASLPDLPTAREQGVDVPVVQYWGGLAAPAGTPKAVRDILEHALGAAVRTPGLQERLAPLGMLPRFADAEGFRKLIEVDLKWLGDAVRHANLKLN
jgi:tripartite-type tricarboxylate transporter receptor subunit TctC